jgi:hypothetical protein
MKNIAMFSFKAILLCETNEKNTLIGEFNGI